MANKAKRRRLSVLSEDHKMTEKLKTPPAEVYDPDDVKLQKIDQLTEVFKSGKNIVIITGAGISTAASIPDYRGVNGLYTRDVDQFDRGFDIRTTVPTISHMVIKELLRNGFANHLISQNCDGLHLRSGISQKYLSEIHGNMYIEFCKYCHGQYIRSYEVSFHSNFRQHGTGRRCGCKWPLTDTIVHAGEKSTTIWPQNWDRAIEEVKQADVILIIGTSGVVLKNYASLWPERATKILINTQPTMIDDKVTWKIGAKSDEVLSRIAQNLGIETGLQYCRNCDFVFKPRPSRPLIQTKFVMCNCHIQPPKNELVLNENTANFGCPGWLKNGLKRMRKMYIYPDANDDDDFNELTDNDDSWSPKNRKRTVSMTKNNKKPVEKRKSARRNLKSALEVPKTESLDEETTNQNSPSTSTATRPKPPPKKRGRKKKFVRRVGRPPRSRSRSVDVEISSLADDYEDITSIQNHVNSDDNLDIQPPLRQEIKVEDPLHSLPPLLPPRTESPQPTPQPTNFGRVLSERVSQRRRTPPPPHYYGTEENNPRRRNPIPGVRNLLAAFEGSNHLPTVDDILSSSGRVPEHMTLSLNSLRRGIVEQRENGADPENERVAYNALADGYEQAFARQQERIANLAAAQAAETAQAAQAAESARAAQAAEAAAAAEAARAAEEAEAAAADEAAAVAEAARAAEAAEAAQAAIAAETAQEVQEAQAARAAQVAYAAQAVQAAQEAQAAQAAQVAQAHAAQAPISARARMEQVAHAAIAERAALAAHLAAIAAAQAAEAAQPNGNQNYEMENPQIPHIDDQNAHIDDPHVEVVINDRANEENEDMLEVQEQRDLEFLRMHDITPPAIEDDALRRHIYSRRREQQEDFLRERERNADLRRREVEREIQREFIWQMHQEVEELEILGRDGPALRRVEDYLVADRTTPPGFLSELHEPEDPEPIEAPAPISLQQEIKEEIIEVDEQLEDPVQVPQNEQIPHNEQIQEAMEVVENENIVEDPVQNNQEIVEHHMDNIQQEMPRVEQVQQNNQVGNRHPVNIVSAQQYNMFIAQQQNLEVQRAVPRFARFETHKFVRIQPRNVAPIQRRPSEEVEYAEMSNVSAHIEVVRHAVEPDFDENFLEGNDEPMVQVERNPQRQPFREDMIPFPEDFLEPQYVDEPDDEYSDQPSTSAASENPSYAVLSTTPYTQTTTLGNFQYNEYSADIHPKGFSANRTCQQEAQLEQRFTGNQTSYYYQDQEGQSSSSQPSSSYESPVNTVIVSPPKPKPKSRSRAKTFANYTRLEDFPILEPAERDAAHQPNFDNIMSIVFTSYGLSLQVNKEEFARFQDMFMQRFGRSTGELQLSQLRQMLRLFKADHCKKT